jgi:hypothetical protein
LETSGDDVHPLEIHGRRVIDCHEQLVGILRNRLGQNHADFFAQPALSSGSRSIVWYTTVTGEVAPVDTLSPDEKQRLTQRAERILADVEGLAAQTASDGPAGATVSEILRAAAQVAPGAPLFSIGGKVVAVLWGHRSASAAQMAAPRLDTPQALAAKTPVQETVQTIASTPAVRARTSADASAQRQRWLVPSLIALVVVALLAWAWHSDLFVRLAGSGDDLGAQIAAAEARNQTLASRISELKKNPASVKCVPAPIPAPPKQSFVSPSGVSRASRDSAGGPGA